MAKICLLIEQRLMDKIVRVANQEDGASEVADFLYWINQNGSQFRGLSKI